MPDNRLGKYKCNGHTHFTKKTYDKCKKKVISGGGTKKCIFWPPFWKNQCGENQHCVGRQGLSAGTVIRIGKYLIYQDGECRNTKNSFKSWRVPLYKKD